MLKDNNTHKQKKTPNPKRFSERRSNPKEIGRRFNKTAYEKNPKINRLNKERENNTRVNSEKTHT